MNKLEKIVKEGLDTRKSNLEGSMAQMLKTLNIDDSERTSTVSYGHNTMIFELDEFKELAKNTGYEKEAIKDSEFFLNFTDGSTCLIQIV